MFTYAKQYVTALGVVLLAMLVYRWTVAVSIEPTGQDKVKPVVFKNTLHTTQWWKQLFAVDSWQQSEPKVLQTPRGILLFKNWTQLGPDQWRLEPLTMIIPQTDSMPSGAQSSDASQSLTEQDVWIVNAEQGAVIQFREAFDWTKGSTPPVTSGRLEGRISITRRAKDISDQRPWMLTTSDVRIDRRHISTIKPVEIRWDGSVIRGRDLSIILKQDLLSNSQDDASPWGVLESMELIYVEEINVGLPPGGLWADMKRSSPELPVVQGLPAQLKVESGGPFRFDFATSQAQLMNGVHAIHQLGSLAPDQFWSQELQVKLTPELRTASKSPQTSTAKVNAPRTPIKVGGLQLKQLVARGMDPVGPINGQTLVRLDAPNIGAAARAKRLNINFLDHQLELSGRLESPQAVSTVATLDYLGYSFRSPLIQYRQDPAAEHLGWLAAAGPGELHVAADSKMGQCNVRWQESMHMKPDGNEQWISLVGKTLVESAVHGFLTSDSLDIWLKPAPATAPKQIVAPESNPSAQATTANFVPDRMRAIGAVTIASQQIKANVNELKLWLVHSTPNAPNASTENLSLSDSAGNPMYQFVSPPAAGNSANAQANAQANAGTGNVLPPNINANPTNVPPVATMQAALNPLDRSNPNGPINVEGSILQSTIIVTDKQSWIDSLTVEGPLKVSGNPTPAAPTPWNVVGQQLQLSTNPAGQVAAQINGSPARVAMGEAWLIGPVIMYDQATGLIWMNQPGEFSVPTETLNRTASNDPTRPAEASKLQWLRAPHCKWKGQLQFDGAVALIEGDIEMNGLVSPQPDRFWQVKGSCQQMEIHLSNPINMQAPKSATANLDRIVLKDSVNIIAAQDDSQGNHLSLEQIAVPILTYHLPNSQIVGAGPGWIRSWHIASSTLGSGGLGQMASSSTERITPKQELQGAHLAFRESMVGYLDKSEVIFEGKVELAVGPLKSWNDLIDLNTMQRLKQDEMLLSSDMLKAYDTSGLGLNVGSASQMQNQGTWEFQALGNVRFAGRTTEGDYSGNGYRVTYTQSKDLLVLEGDGRTPAHIRKDPLPNSREQVLEADVNSAAINVKTMATQDVRITRVAIEAPGTSQPPAGLGPAPTNSNTPIQQRDTKTPDPRSPAWLRPRE